MTRKLADVLKSIPDEDGREEILSLGREVHDSAHGDRSASGAAREKQLLQTMVERIQWHFRAARYAVPSADELRQMVDDHFG